MSSPSKDNVENSAGAIEKVGDEFCVVSKKGKKLGCYATREEALTRLRQIEFFKRNGFVKGNLVVKEAPDMVQYESTTASSKDDQDDAITRNTKGSVLETIWQDDKEV
tara:strand:- start:4200 stop:4523 length:324 start_codon:yes stop_codon:yes gene_type:complete